MPFGSDPFRDKEAAMRARNGQEACHQCLSAVIPFGTDIGTTMMILEI